MGWTTIDDGAFTTDSDSPLSAAHCVKIRDNAAYVSENRPPQTGIAFPKDEPVRLCTFVPMCLGPFWIYLPPGESYTEINVRLRIEDCEWEGASAGDDAAYLHVTTGRRGDGFIQKPPSRPTDWDHTVEKGDSGLLTFSEIEIFSDDDQYGWKPVFLWIWSNYRNTHESSGAIEMVLGQNNAIGIEALSPAPANQPPERVLIVEPEGGATQGYPMASDIFQLAYYHTSDGSQEWAELFPRITPDSYISADAPNDVVYSTAEYKVYACGVVLLQSISIEAVAPDFEPVAAAYHSDTPAGEQWLTLSQTVNQLVHYRTPQWLCHPGPDSVEVGEHSRIWPIRADAGPTGYLGAADLDASTWKSLAACLVLEEPVDDNGYFAIVSIVYPRFSRWGTDDENDRVRRDLKLRLSAYTAGTTTLQASGATETLDAFAGRLGEPRDLAYAPRAEAYSPLYHALAGSTWHEAEGSSWQQRGLLGFRDPSDPSTPHDWLKVSNIMLPRLPQDSLNYTSGIRVVIEGQLSAVDTNQLVVVIGAGIRSGV